MPYRNIITRIKQNMLDDENYKKTISRYKTCDVILDGECFK